MPGPWNMRDRPMRHGPHGAGPYGFGPWHGGPPPEWRTPKWFTLWAPVVLSFAIQVPAAFVVARLSGLGMRQTAIAVALAAAGSLVLIAARRFPGPVVAIVAVLASIDLFVHPGSQDRGGPPYVALAFAIISAVVRGARTWAWISIAVAWIATVTAGTILDLQWEPGRVALTTLGILIVFGVGEALRGRRDRAKEWRRLQGERRQSAVQAERVRIARELHDVLAHSLSQINVQAGVGLHLMNSQPEKAADALASIKETSKSALDEVRSVLGVLRAEGADAGAPLVPEPSLDRLAGLVASVSTASLTVSLDDELDHAEVPAPVQLALFRIVQESLTNIGRHADRARTATVSLRRDDGAYRVEVRNDGTASKATASESGGRGLLGMRERAELLGGHLSAGPGEGGGFVVSAEIPVREVRA
jgi:signal transduction histidine kinase